MKKLTIIPAIESRSKIPKLYSRFLLGKPLILYSIHLAKQIENNNIYLLTDDENIAHIGEINKIKSIFFPDIIDDLTGSILNVIREIYSNLQNKIDQNYDFVLLLNPNFPLIRAGTINYYLKNFSKNNEFFAITVKDSNFSQQNLWYENQKDSDARFQKLKINNQIKQIYEELDAFNIIKREYIDIENDFLKGKVKVIKLDFPENLQVKNHIDWWIAEKFLKRRKILIRVDGYREIGYGHIYRMLTLANSLIDHEILFVSNGVYRSGIRLIKESNYPINIFHSDEEYDQIIEKFAPDIIFNDILDTDWDYIKKLKKRNIYVVNFEDLGEGAKEANLVINALYEKKRFLNNYYWGKEYYILREEFYLVNRKTINEKVKNILITFGGTDPNNYTLRVLKILNELQLDDIKIYIILGLGYQNQESLSHFINNIDLDLLLKHDVNNISKYMYKSDLIFTSGGRTVYEIASIGTPTIVLYQNEREMLHSFANEKNGIINLGLGFKISNKQIKATTLNIISNYKLRLKLNRKMLKNNLESGISNVISLIFSQYEKFESEVL